MGKQLVGALCFEIPVTGRRCTPAVPTTARSPSLSRTGPWASPHTAAPTLSPGPSLVQLVGLAMRVVQLELGVQVVQLSVAAQQEAAHLQGTRAGEGGKERSA